MKTLATLSASLVCAVTLSAQSPSPTPRDIVTAERTYKGAVVTRRSADGLDIRFSGGMAHLLFRELPADMQKEYNYDPQAAARAEAADQAEQQRNFAAGQLAQQQANQRTQQEKQQAIQQEASEAKQVKREMIKPKIKQWKTGLAVVSSFEGGIIAQQWANGIGVIDDDIVYAVYGLDGTDGERIQERALYEAGTFTYTSVTGAHKKIKAYALTPDDALAKQGY